MSIWEYNASNIDRKILHVAMDVGECPFCRALLEVFSDDLTKVERGPSVTTGTSISRRVSCCPACGWWRVSSSRGTNFAGKLTVAYSGAIGSLRELDLADHSVPIEEIRSFLVARYDRRFDLAPDIFENVVASVFRGHGYRTRVTGRSGDGGIDVIMDGPDNSVTGIQVKRYRGTIQVEQIRSLCGALLLAGITRGIFVTTSKFSSGSQDVADLSALRGIPIELIDAPRFYDALGLAQRAAYRSASDIAAPYTNVPLMYYASDTRRTMP